MILSAVSGIALPVVVLAWLATMPVDIHAACECGYRDPATQALWTDATIVYFNETGMQQVVFPSTSPASIYGDTAPGDSGLGQEAFTALGDFINPYENDFGATFRTAVSYNNTFAIAADKNNTSSNAGLAMQISPANLQKHIVNSSQVITRRRDIQYGSFRALIQHANVTGSGGGAFQFAVAFNESEIVDTGIYLADKPENSTLRWSFSAAGADADPIKKNLTFLNDNKDPRTNNLTYLNTREPVEHRMDWLSPRLVQFRNNGQNNTMSFLAYEKGKNATNLPTSPAPVSFKTWANGEPSMSQGPPLVDPLITRIVYVRFFYNSTLATRNVEFQQQCSQTRASVCDTEDHTLRNSTNFSTDSLMRILPVKIHFRPPIWGIVPSAFFSAVFVAIVIHGMFINAAKARRQQKHHAPEQDERPASSIRPTSNLRPFGLQQSSDLSKKYLSTAAMSEEAGQLDELYRDWVDSDSEYDSDDYDDAEVIEGQLEQPQGPRTNRLSSMFRRRRSSSAAQKKKGKRESVRLSVFGGMNKQQAEASESTQHLAPLRPIHTRLDSYRFGGPSVSADSTAGNDDAVGQGRSTDKRLSQLESDANSQPPRRAAGEGAFSSRWQQANAHPTIVNWQSRAVDSSNDVGRLARPVSMAPSHRLSIVPVQQSFLYMTLQRLRHMIFVGGGSDASGPTTSTGTRRIDYLDGMRGFACLGVSVAHFMLMFYHSVSDDNVLSMHYPTMERMIRRIVAPIYINPGLLLGIFFVLPSRTTSYLTRGGLASMADAVLRRLPRLALPVMGASLINYMLIDVQGYRWVRSLASVTWSTWAYYQNYDNVLTFVNAFITLWWAAPPDSPALLTTYATGVLWTIPLIVQGWWTCLLCALVAHEMKRAWKRFAFYAICIVVSWYANTWDMFFMGGLVIADLDNNLKYREKAEKGVRIPLFGIRVKGVVFAWLFFAACLTQQYFLFNQGAPGGDLNMIEYGYHPDLNTSTLHNATQGDMVYHYQDPRVWSWFIVMSMFILADLSTWFQVIWRLRIWAWLGKHSLALFLLHGCVFWTWGAWLFILLSQRSVPYWANALITFITSYILLLIASVCFTNTFEYWAGLFSKACMRAATGAYGRKL